MNPTQTLSSTLKRGHRFEGLIAATHTPFHQDGSLNLLVVEAQAESLLRDGVTTVFIGGSTGECHSLTFEERSRLTERWFQVAQGTPLRIIVHVGSNCLADSQALALQAQRRGAAAVSAVAPSYYKPSTVADLVSCCQAIAGAIPDALFYYYDIPSLTGVNLSMPEFLADASSRIPNLSGIKYTNPDLAAFQLCLAVEGGRFDILWGVDEVLLGSLALGARGAVGSTYNFAAPMYRRMVTAFERGDLDTARREQLRAVELVRILSRRGFMASAKALMGFRGIEVGPPRLPFSSLTGEQSLALHAELAAFGLLDGSE